MNVSDFWTDYKEKVVPTNAPEVQVVETRKAFYAGGIALVSLIHQMDMTDPAKSFKAIEDELMQFAASVGVMDATIN